ncbi:MAG TPA: fibronectin type III domain-containing protein [Thermoanaerobaculia bacterium]|nr:fibronectin type III domain-containing protein [Thermoanaerobaculia bacterium]
MTKLPCLRAAVLFFLAPLAFAQQLTFGERIPLSNTYYTTEPAIGVLTANDVQPFMAWASPSAVRVTRLDGLSRVERPILDLGGVTDLDIVWTGSHFFVAAVTGRLGVDARIVGRLLDRNGEPAGEPLELATEADRPRLASNGTHIVLLYRTREEIRALRLGSTGTPLAPAEAITTRVTWGEVSNGHDIASNGRGFAALTVEGSTVQSTIFNQLGLVTRQATKSIYRLNSQSDASVALASNGEDYFGVWPNGSVLLGTLLEANGELGPPFGVVYIYTTALLRWPAVTFDGERYYAAVLDSAPGQATRANFAEVEPHIRAVEAQENAVLTAQESMPTLVSIHGRVLAGWRDLHTLGLKVRDLKNRTETETVVTIGANDQKLAAATTSNDGVLGIWTESSAGRRMVRTGIWKYDGGWIETEIVTSATPRLVASDGVEFAAVFLDSNGWSAYLLDREGRPLSSTGHIHGSEVFDLVFNGTSYVLAYRDAQGNAAVARFGRTGDVFSPVLVSVVGPADEIANMSLASDGRNVLVAWQRNRTEICFPVCDPVRETLSAMLLGPLLERLIPEDLPLAGEDSHHPKVAWDGDEYRTVWHTAQEFFAGTVTASGERLRITRRIADASPAHASRHDMDLVELGGAVAMTWKESAGPFLLITDTTAVPFDAPVAGPRAMTRMANGGAAFFGTEVRIAPPHHGAQRVVARFGDPVGPGPVADPPIVSAERDGNRVRVSWTPPSQPVRGYRLEYRRGDGSWNEYSRWFEQNQHELNWGDLRYGEPLAFRVRAVTEAGMSLYSVPAIVNIGKRRSSR